MEESSRHKASVTTKLKEGRVREGLSKFSLSLFTVVLLF